MSRLVTPQTAEVTLDNGAIRVGVLVSSGARMVELIDVQTGRNWLTVPFADPAAIPAHFADGTRSGFDDCLPSIVALIDPNSDEGGSRRAILDHGDFWNTPWTLIESSATRMVLATHGARHPLRVSKTLQIGDRASVVINYRVETDRAEPYLFLYSAHPLLTWDADAVLDLPDAELIAGFPPDAVPEPIRRLRHDGPSVNTKFFVRSDGRCALWFAGSERVLTLTQGSTLPWLGVCINREAWPSAEARERWIALEPTNSPTDDLLEAIEGGTALAVSVQHPVEFSIGFSFADVTQRGQR